MITCKFQEVTESEARAFREWSTHPAAETCVAVAKGKEAAATCDAAQRALKVSTDTSNNIVGSMFDKARRYTIFLEVWREITGESGKPKVAILQNE